MRQDGGPVRPGTAPALTLTSDHRMNMAEYEERLREVIADVRALRERGTLDEPDQAFALRIEAKLGGLLPPIAGTFNIDLQEVIKRLR